MGHSPGSLPTPISLPQSGRCISPSGQGWLKSHRARERPWDAAWERVGAWSKARDRRQRALKALPSAGGMEVSHEGGNGSGERCHAACQNHRCPHGPEGAEDKARERRGRGKLKRGLAVTPIACVPLPNRPRKGRHTCPRGAPATLGKHGPGTQNPVCCCCCCRLRQARRDEGCKMRKQSKT